MQSVLYTSELVAVVVLDLPITEEAFTSLAQHQGRVAVPVPGIVQWLASDGPIKMSETLMPKTIITWGRHVVSLRGKDVTQWAFFTGDEVVVKLLTADFPLTEEREIAEARSWSYACGLAAGIVATLRGLPAPVIRNLHRSRGS